jgi:ABC-type multidrug transport system ATPase subunit/ABC-type multidrug transport system permease subunit
MGPSGSGKTTLLSIAAGLINDKEAFSPESKIRINNHPTNFLRNVSSSNERMQQFPKDQIGVVWQDDLLFSNLTVRETIEFAARLKTPMSAQDKVPGLVDQIINDLRLNDIEHSRIGSPTQESSLRGISGGERKRVSVAQELVTRPPLIFLDEPTSGLDAFSALELMTTLKTLAQNGGHSIVVVIHQPRTTIFELLDTLLLLSRGEEVFSGDAHHAKKVLETCPVVGFPLPDQTNVADWMIDVISSDEKKEQRRKHTEIESNDKEFVELRGGMQCKRNLPNHWLTIKRDLEMESNNEQELDDLSSLSALRSNGPKHPCSFEMQLQLLVQRAIKQGRGEKLNMAGFIVACAFTSFESILWFQLPDDTNHIYDRNSIIFFLIIAQANGIVISAVPVFRRQRQLMNRERAKKMYGVLPYFIANTLSDATTNVLMPLIHAMVVYWIVNLRPAASSFFLFCLIFYLTLTTAQSMGLLFSIVLPTLQIALLVTPMLVLFLMIVAGFYIPFSNMPSWIRWTRWLSFASYGYSGILANEYGGRQIPCAETVIVGIGSPDSCPFQGDNVLNALGIDGALSNVWFDIFMLVILQTFFRGCSYYLLRRSN